MKKSLYIDNFKCFKDTIIELGNLTVLAGANSVGKSTTIQALLLLKVIETALLNKQKTVPLNGVFAQNLGTTREVLNVNASSDEITIVLEDDVQYPNILNKPYLSLVVSNKNRSSAFLDIKFHSEQYTVSADASYSKLKDFYYLNAERVGPRLRYDTGNSSKFVGHQGEFTIFVLDNIKDEKIKKSDLRIFDNNEVSTYIRQTELWMQYITSVKDKMITQVIEAANIALVKYGQSSATNVGFGISYVLPIIVNGLLAEKGSMMIVENPEAHLHPSGQSRIGQFLAHVAASGVQVVVETHSEHVINGMRIAAISNVISNEDIIINFFSKKEGDEQPTINKIEINQMGDLTKFPYGFFDQAIHDTTTIVKTRKNKRNEQNETKSLI
jgi:predicted ATPase